MRILTEYLRMDPVIPTGGGGSTAPVPDANEPPPSGDANKPPASTDGKPPAGPSDGGGDIEGWVPPADTEEPPPPPPGSSLLEDGMNSIRDAARAASSFFSQINTDTATGERRDAITEHRDATVESHDADAAFHDRAEDRSFLTRTRASVGNAVEDARRTLSSLLEGRGSSGEPGADAGKNNPNQPNTPTMRPGPSVLPGTPNKTPGTPTPTGDEAKTNPTPTRTATTPRTPQQLLTTLRTPTTPRTPDRQATADSLANHLATAMNEGDGTVPEGLMTEIAAFTAEDAGASSDADDVEHSGSGDAGDSGGAKDLAPDKRVSGRRGSEDGGGGGGGGAGGGGDSGALTNPSEPLPTISVALSSRMCVLGAQSGEDASSVGLLGSKALSTMGRGATRALCASDDGLGAIGAWEERNGSGSNPQDATPVAGGEDETIGVSRGVVHGGLAGSEAVFFTIPGVGTRCIPMDTVRLAYDNMRAGRSPDEVDSPLVSSVMRLGEGPVTRAVEGADAGSSFSVASLGGSGRLSDMTRRSYAMGISSGPSFRRLEAGGNAPFIGTPC